MAALLAFENDSECVTVNPDVIVSLLPSGPQTDRNTSQPADSRI